MSDTRLRDLEDARGLIRAHRPSARGEARQRDDSDIPDTSQQPVLGEGLIEGLRATLEAGMAPEELAVRVTRLIDLLVVELERPKGY